MRGHLFACDWLQDLSPLLMSTKGDASHFVATQTRALWVPDAGILIQWVLPDGRMQVSKPKSFPPPAGEARVALLDDRQVPYKVIKEARRYMELQEHRQAQQKTVQSALDRITEGAIRSESRLQAVTDKFLRDAPVAAGKRRMTK